MGAPHRGSGPAPRIVVVEWGDAFIDTEDFEQKDADKTKPIARVTTGFLAAKNQHGLVLATDYYPKKKDGKWSGKLFIPWGMVERWYNA